MTVFLGENGDVRGEMIAYGNVVDIGTLAALYQYLDRAVRQLQQLQDRRERTNLI